jgi:solute carrier family 6 amino acid transporter-like protein 5/7/9/14
MKTPADEFFHYHILQISDSIEDQGGIVWPLLLCNVIAWTITYLCIMKGVKSVGKVVYFTATFPFFILFVLLIRGLTLPGAWDGVFFYIYPQWHQLTNLKVWADAACQIFFSLGPGWGGIVNMASYNHFRNNNQLDSILVPILNCGTSIFAGFVVFSVIGFMSHETGLPISTVATGGPGLAFVTYPEAITMLPWPHVWAILFFLMLFFLGLDSCVICAN